MHISLLLPSSYIHKQPRKLPESKKLKSINILLNKADPRDFFTPTLMETNWQGYFVIGSLNLKIIFLHTPWTIINFYNVPQLSQSGSLSGRWEMRLFREWNIGVVLMNYTWMVSACSFHCLIYCARVWALELIKIPSSKHLYNSLDILLG